MCVKQFSRGVPLPAACSETSDAACQPYITSGGAGGFEVDGGIFGGTIYVREDGIRIPIGDYKWLYPDPPEGSWFNGGWSSTLTPHVQTTIGIQTASAPSNWSWWATVLRNGFSKYNYAVADIDAYDKGYFDCVGEEVFPFKGLMAAGLAKGAELLAERSIEKNARTIAGGLYNLKKLGGYTFKAWGTSAKAYFPRVTAEIRSITKAVGAAGVLYTEAEFYRAIYTCSDRLSGK